jgi:DNA-binding response OmpR family regulator
VDGLAVLVQSRRLYPAMPVIMMTGHSGRELESLVLAAGAQRCLYKPFDFAELEYVVQQWLQAAA